MCLLCQKWTSPHIKVLPFKSKHEQTNFVLREILNLLRYEIWQVLHSPSNDQSSWKELLSNTEDCTDVDIQCHQCAVQYFQCQAGPAGGDFQSQVYVSSECVICWL